MLKRIYTDWPALQLKDSSEIHLWQLNLDHSPVSNSDLSRLLKALSPDEINRADQIRYAERRQAFVQTRYWLRSLLAHYTGTTLTQICIESNAHGKPRLAGTAEHQGLVFNVSHTDGMAILAFGRNLPIGVDVECVVPDRVSPRLVRYTLAIREFDHWLQLGPQQKASFFFRCWCAKEAFAKATGRGLALGIKNIVAHELSESFYAVPPEFGPADQWHLHTWHQDHYHYSLVYHTENATRPSIRTFTLPLSLPHPTPWQTLADGL